MTDYSYDQIELDTREDLDRAMETVGKDAITTALRMIVDCGVTPAAVHGRHEAYGIAAEHLAAINRAVKEIKDDVSTLLSTLADPNYPAIEATGSIVGSTSRAVITVLRAAAEMRRTLDGLYAAEIKEPLDAQPPLDTLAGELEEVDPDDSGADE